MPYKDPEKARAYIVEYKRRYRHRWAARQQALDAARHANERANKYGCEGVITADEAQELFSVGACHYCESSYLLGIDHVVPLSAGGLNRPENMVIACRSCNSSKCRQDRPRRWSRLHDACIDCADTDRKHRCHGRCNRCHQRMLKSKRINEAAA